jgi:N-methylhydantoinase A/oxoprolinase/acetone carboxylase beta subunit
MPAVIVPPRAGVLSAVGLLGAPARREIVRSVGRRGLDAVVGEVRDELERIAADLGSGTARSLAFDCRYDGQSHEITVTDPDDFERVHRARNGFGLERPVEVVAVRGAVEVASPVRIDALPPVERATLRGPCVVSESDCTVFVPAGWRGRVGPLGAWILERS